MDSKPLKSPEPVWITLGIIYTATLIFIGWSAYTDNLPAYLDAIPYYDTAGHFIIYGVATYLGQRIFQRSFLKLGWLQIPLFPLGFALLTVIEEGLQSLSPVRTFSLLDLVMSIAGLSVGYYLARSHQRRSPTQPTKHQ